MRNFFILCLLFPSLFLAQQKSVLFIGNSYTSVNNLPSLTAQLANSLGDNLIVDSNIPGGYTLQGHSTNATTLNKIALGTWDFVVLQDQSQRPSFPPTQVATDVFPYAEELVSKIRLANECTEPLFYMTWGRENGDQQNCASYAPLCTYNGMQTRLKESYMEMGNNNQATISPVGVAWKYTRDNYPLIDLYAADGSHPSIAGSYLAACVFYASIYRKSPEGASFLSSLSQTTATTLQEISKLIVIDSLDSWRIGANDFTLSTVTQSPNISACQIIEFSSITDASNFSWFFQNGDENSYDADGAYNTNANDYGATASIQSPSIYYNSDGTFNVTLIADDNCTSDTLNTEVTLSCLNSIAENELKCNLKRENNKIYLEFTNGKNRRITLYDIDGKTVLEKQTTTNVVSFDLNILPKIVIINIEEAQNKQRIIKFTK